MIGVVVSRSDRASVTIGEQLRSIADWEAFDDPTNPDGWGDTGYRRPGITIREFDPLHLDLDGVASAFDDPSLIVFASRHSGETGPLLSTHFTGNVGPAEYGGRPKALAEAAPNAARTVLATLHETAPTGYSVSLECTHHGPSAVGVPSLFVEVGSNPPQWADEAATRAAATAIHSVVEVDPRTDRSVVIIGEGHYAPRGTRIVEETDWAVGHIAPDWALEETGGLDDAVRDELFERSGTSLAVVTDDYEALGQRLEEAGYTVVSERWLRETTGVPLDRVDTLETALCPVAEGLRFGALADTTDPITIEELGAQLVDAVNGVDVGATRTAVAETTVAFRTTDGGSRVAGPVAVPAGPGLDPVIDEVIAVLETGYDAVDRTEDAIVVTETVFDPERARELGVPEGPAFGRLADGEPVTIDGEPVTPEQVLCERTHRLPR